MYFVYVLKSESHDWIYVGMTSNIHRRIEDHNKGYNKSTRPYRPFTLLMKKEFEDSLSARKQEKYWKSGIGKEQIKKAVASLSTDR
ncbi:MAG TPA: GIY-YIG nuclease family protein [Candidatus Absconditabacterales bacterium]|nr:GIY-YIG nuclease family protein [Candidatus Absconditabacterales bacterium]